MQTEQLDVVGPGCGVAATHLQDIHHHGMDRGAGIGPDVVQEAESPDVENCFNWELAEEEVECGDGRGAAEFEEASQHFVLEDF